MHNQFTEGCSKPRLGAPWGVLGRLGGVLEPPWGRLGASWDVWVPFGSVLKASWGILGCLDFLGAVQACPGGVTRGRVRRLVAVLEPSWGRLGASWDVWVPFLGAS